MNHLRRMWREAMPEDRFIILFGLAQIFLGVFTAWLLWPA